MPLYALHIKNSHQRTNQDKITSVNPDSLPLVFKHFWFLFIVVTCLNGAIWWSRGRKQMAQNPALETGYRRLIRGWLIYANVPWLVMGAGILSGSVPSTLHYFNPRNGPFVVAFYVSIVALQALCFYWLFFRGGAEDLIAHPGLLNFPTQNPTWVKAFFLLNLAGGIAVLLILTFGNIVTPR